MENFRKLVREFNTLRDYVRSLRPLPSNTESLEHTALGTRRGSVGGTTTTAATVTLVWD